MANPKLHPCPDCGQDCSAEALLCPKCGKPFSRESKQDVSIVSDAIHAHILSIYPGKVGTCLTLLGLFRVVEGVTKVRHVLDELLAIVALGFIVSGLSSYYALKEKRPNRKRWLDLISHRLFAASVLGLAIICAVAGVFRS